MSYNQVISPLMIYVINIATNLRKEEIRSIPAIPIGNELVPIDDPDLSLQRWMTIYKDAIECQDDIGNDMDKPSDSQQSSNERTYYRIELDYVTAIKEYCLLKMRDHLSKFYNRGKSGTSVFRSNDELTTTRSNNFEDYFYIVISGGILVTSLS